MKWPNLVTSLFLQQPLTTPSKSKELERVYQNPILACVSLYNKNLCKEMLISAEYKCYATWFVKLFFFIAGYVY